MTAAGVPYRRFSHGWGWDPKPKKTAATPKLVAAYVRVSSKDQKTDSQREEIRRWLEGSGIAPDKAQTQHS